MTPDVLNAVMADVYGPQQLLHDGSMPAALVFGHPGFLRSCHGIVPPGGCFLHQVAFDLARGPDGRWRVAGTRCQAPSGAGYALENRITISRLFSDAFREMHVHMLASFFRTLQETLLASSPSATDVVRVHYRGTFPDGKEFDSSFKRGEPAEFPLNGVIPCWTEGVQLMKVGGKARLTCPPGIAYGKRGAGGVIPPDATLNFEIELLGIKGK